MEAQQEMLGTGHPASLASQASLAVQLRKLGKYTAAKMHLYTAASLWRSQIGEQDEAKQRDALPAMHNLALELSVLGHPKKALQHLQRVLQVSWSWQSSRHARAQGCQSHLPKLAVRADDVELHAAGNEFVEGRPAENTFVQQSSCRQRQAAAQQALTTVHSDDFVEEAWAKPHQDGTSTAKPPAILPVTMSSGS